MITKELSELYNKILNPRFTRCSNCNIPFSEEERKRISWCNEENCPNTRTGKGKYQKLFQTLERY